MVAWAAMGGGPPPPSPTIYFSNPNTPMSRENLTIFRSFTDGTTWPADVQTLIYSGLGGYSCLTQLPAGEEGGGSQQAGFAVGDGCDA